jgi:hypothetical protein
MDKCFVLISIRISRQERASTISRRKFGWTVDPAEAFEATNKSAAEPSDGRLRTKFCEVGIQQVFAAVEGAPSKRRRFGCEQTQFSILK